MKQIHFPYGKRNPDGTWNTRVSITSQDEEWEHADLIEYLECDEHGMDTIENVDFLKIRFGCQGRYDKLIEIGYPFPSTRTLQRRVADVHFPLSFLS